MQTPGRARSILMLPCDAQSARTARLRSQACAAGGGACAHSYRACVRELAPCAPSSLRGCGKIIQHGTNGIMGDGTLYKPDRVHANELACVSARLHVCLPRQFVLQWAPACSLCRVCLLPAKPVLSQRLLHRLRYRTSTPPGAATAFPCFPSRTAGAQGAPAAAAQATRKGRKIPFSPPCQWKPQRYECCFFLLFLNPPNCCFLSLTEEKSSRRLQPCTAKRAWRR